MHKNLYFSAYSHLLQHGDVYCYFHALRIRPVYVQKELYELIERIRLNPDVEELFLCCDDPSIASSFKRAVDSLVEAKVLVKNDLVDPKVIKNFRANIPEPYPHIAYFILTENCNFSCSYCFVKRDEDVARNNRTMSHEVAHKGLDFFCNQIAQDASRFSEEKNIIFYGGEPLLNLDTLKFIVEKIEHYQQVEKLPANVKLTIITNGSLLTSGVIDFLSEHKVGIAVSLDGDADTTNSCRSYARGGGVYDDVVAGINLCREKNVPFSLSVTLSEKSVENFEKTMLELDAFDCKTLGFNILLTDEHFKVGEGYNEKAAEFIIKAFQHFRMKGIYEDRIMRKVKSFSDAKCYLFDCGAAGGNQVVIAPDGNVGICHGYIGERKYFPTTIYDGEFDAKSNPVFVEWGKRTPLNMEECQACVALGICGGGCPLNAEKNSGSIWGMDERFCIHAQKTLNWLIWDLYEKM